MDLFGADSLAVPSPRSGRMCVRPCRPADPDAKPPMLLRTPPTRRGKDGARWAASFGGESDAWPQEPMNLTVSGTYDARFF